MTCIYQDCQNCPHCPKSEHKAEPFDRDVAMRSLEFAAVRLGMHWGPARDDEIEIAVMADITELVREIRSAIIDGETGRVMA
jgi:hypothetical protein